MLQKTVFRVLYYSGSTLNDILIKCLSYYAYDQRLLIQSFTGALHGSVRDLTGTLVEPKLINK